MSSLVSYALEQYVGKAEWTPFALLDGFEDLSMRMVAIQLPIALISVLQTVENVEAAELCGDGYSVNEAIIANALAIICGACSGAVTPTTVYIGHKRHKVSGATAAYSICNGLAFMILMFTGLMGEYCSAWPARGHACGPLLTW